MSKEWTDTELLALIEDECLDVRCRNVPIADTGDADIAWDVIEHHQAEPHDRVIGSGKTAREALIDSQRKPCGLCDGTGVIDDDPEVPMSKDICGTCKGIGKI